MAPPLMLQERALTFPCVTNPLATTSRVASANPRSTIGQRWPTCSKTAWSPRSSHLSRYNYFFVRLKRDFNESHKSDYLKCIYLQLPYQSSRDEIGSAITHEEWGNFIDRLKGHH